MLAYVGGATLEAIGLYAVYSLAYSLKRGYRRGVITSLVAFLAMACISVVGQLAFLKSNLSLSVPVGTIRHLPLLSILVGAYGGSENDVFFLFRAAGYHLGGILVALLALQRTKTASQILAEKRERQHREIETQQTQLFLDFQKAHATGFLHFMQKRLDAPTMITIAELTDKDADGAEDKSPFVAEESNSRKGKGK